jgi:hypothetical protein
MRLKGAWGIVAKLVSMAAVICCVVLGTVFVGAGKRGNTSNAGSLSAEAKRATKPIAVKDKSAWVEAYGRLPMSFEENQGQTAREVRFVAHGGRYELFLTPQEAVMALRPNKHLDFSPQHRSAYLRALREQRRAAEALTAIRIRFEGANPEPQIFGSERQPTRVNYFTGSDPKNWHTDIPAYARVKYAGVYPGVDLVFYGNQRRLEYDFVVAPGADAKAIRLKIDGARKMRINSRGDLVLSVAEGEVEFQKPVTYQMLNGEKHEIAGNYVIAADHRVTFSVADYNRKEPLILDPILDYSTYLGGSGAENTTLPVGIAVDSAGDAFVVGDTFSANFPTTANGFTPGPLTGNLGASFVAELNPTGTQLLYSTYLTGSTTNASDGATSVAVDTTGKVYVTGITLTAGFPSKNPITVPLTFAADTTNGTCFVTELDPTQSGPNSLVFSTYMGGTNGMDLANGIAVDANGNIYVAGQTFSTDFPVVNGVTFNPVNTNNASGSAFLSRINPATSTLVYSTYLSGNAVNAASDPTIGGENAYGVAVDGSNNAYVTGGTTSNNASGFPSSANANEPAPPAANVTGSAFVTKVNTAGNGTASLVYSTYIAGSTQETGYGIALGPNNIAYVTGLTKSGDFPFTAGAFDTSGPGNGKAFLVLVDTTNAVVGNPLTPFRYATFLGGTTGNVGYGIKVDGNGNVYIAGTTTSLDFPGTNAGTGTLLGGFQTTRSNPFGTPFIAKLLPTIGGSGANDLLYSTYFGGTGNGGGPDQAYGIAIDSASPPNAYITGQTFSADMPVTGAGSPPPPPFQANIGGAPDSFVAKLSLIPTLAVSPGPGTTLAFGTVLIGTTSPAQTVTLTNNTNAAIAFTSAIAYTGNPPAAPPVQSTDYLVTNTCGASIAAGASCTVSVKFKPSVVGAEPGTLVVADADSTSPQNFVLSGTGANPTPVVVLAPTSLTFSSQLLNTTSAAQTVTLTNSGTGPLTINSIAASGDFAETSTGATACPISPATLPATAGSNTCTISVTFTPTATGTRPGTLTITDNASGSPHTVALTGTGTTAAPGVGLAPTSLAFGNQALTTTSAAKTVTLTNTGTAALTITSIAASGDFAVSNNPCGAGLAAGANCIISVTFTPTVLGARAGNLTITDNAAGSPHTVPLTGTGTGTPDFGLTGPAGVQNVALGQTLNFNVTVTGSGGFNSSVTLACTGAPTLAVCTVTSPVNPTVAAPTIQAQVSMTTVAFVVPPQGMPTPTAPPRQVVPLVLALMLLFSLVWVRRPRLRLAMATAVLTLIAITGCTGLKHQSTPKGAATLTITGTSTTPALSHNVQVQISVN